MAKYQWVYKDKRYLRSRAFVIVRDGGICQRCKSAPGTECHHIKPLDDISSNPMKPNIFICFSPRNLQMLCHDCHNRIDNEGCADDVMITIDGDIIRRS